MNGTDAVRGDAGAELGAWRNFDTAPKDGAEVLAWDGKFCWLARWVDSAGGWDVGATDRYGDTVYATDLTHWMPLPAPPRNASVPSHGAHHTGDDR